MNEYDESVLRLRRNVEGLQSAMKHFEKRAEEDAKRIIHLQNTISDLMATVQSLSQNVAILRALTTGRGPTVS